MDEIKNILTPDQLDRIEKLKAKATITEHRGLCQRDCPTCDGGGFVRFTDEEDVPRTAPCPNRTQKQLTKASGLMSDELLHDWNIVLDDGLAKKAESYARHVLTHGGWLYLWGPPGLAKTVILKVAVAVAIRSGKKGTYTNMSAILDHMRAAYDTDYPSRESINRLAHWGEIDVLAIDEFDRVKQTEYAQEKTFRLMDERYQSGIRQESVTLMASNSPPTMFEGYLADRIEDGRFKVFQLKGDSMRPAMGE